MIDKEKDYLILTERSEEIESADLRLRVEDERIRKELLKFRAWRRRYFKEAVNEKVK